MSANVEQVVDDGGEARKVAQVDFIGGKPCGGADGVIVDALDVRELNVPIGLSFVADHDEQYGHSVVDTLDTAVGSEVVGARGVCIDAEELVGERGRFRPNWRPCSERVVTGHPQRGM